MSNVGIVFEGDDKHVTGLVEEWNMQECSAVSTPYAQPPAVLLTSEGRSPMPPKDATLCRRAAGLEDYVCGAP